MRPSISTHEDGVALVDPIERRRLVLETDGDVDLRSASPDAIPFPVDVAARVTVRTLSLPRTVGAFVRDPSGEVVQVPAGTADDRLPAGEYVVELNAPLKVYLAAAGPLHLSTADGVSLAFDETTEVVVGARSYHKHPSGTVTTTTDPADLRAAVSVLSSALKTTAPERSYPTLRGHPPLLDLGDELDVPADLSRPDVGVRLVVPDAVGATLVVAPLAYYLGAEVVPGGRPRLETDDGFEHVLDGGESFSCSVARTLEHVFFLDCLTRAEGYTGVPLAERDAVEATLDLDFARVYGMDFEARLEAYLSVPRERLVDHLPTWGVTAHLPPEASSVEPLPFLVDQLATVRTDSPSRASNDEIQRYALGRFLHDKREGAAAASARGPASAPTRRNATPRRRTVEADSRNGRGDDPDDFPSVVRVPETDAMEDVWFGDGIPLNATKGLTAAYRNALDRDPREGAIDITVVCNDDEMGVESDVAQAVYGSRSELPFDVTVLDALTTDELRGTLAERTDFLHYVGHVDPGGFRCTDGTLDAATLDDVGVDAFFLNACQSYEQGRALVEAGSIGGVVTFSDVVNDGAVRLGGSMARLLNLGFPLRAALSIASRESLEGAHYLVVGDGSLDVVQDEHGLPILYESESLEGETIEVTIRGFLPNEGGMGTVARPFVGPAETHYLAPGVLGTFRVPKAELRTLFDGGDVPLSLGGTLMWNDDIEWR